MGHLSLYRAFRPSRFEQMVRQEHVVTILKNQVMTDAVGHAYLFCGPRGTGKTSVARIFARAVNCEHPENGSPCGKCAVCRALADGGNLDITEIDAASNNGVNEMRDLREKVQYPPVAGRYKVYIIDEVHMLTDSAFNALLKTLEEPPRHAIFILATTEPQKIPATILSRCMRLDFKLIPEADLEAHLRRILDEIGKPYEEEAVAAIARAGAGSDRDMLSIAEMCLSYEEKLTYRGVTEVLGSADVAGMSALCGAVLRADLSDALARTEAMLSEGKSVGVLLRDLLQFLNQAAIVKACRNAEDVLALPQDVYSRVKGVADEADGSAILRATEIFAEAETGLRFSSSPRISLETAIVKAAAPRTDRDVDALLARISALEKKLDALEGGALPLASAREPLPPAEGKAAEIQPLPPRQEESGFPTEEPVFEEAYFSDPPPAAPVRGAPEASPAAETVQAAPEKPPRAAPPDLPARAAAGKSAREAFGLFMRALRKRSRSGVLFTMCSDLEAEFEGERFVLYTESETIRRSLGREDHAKAIGDTLASLGITSYEVRLRERVSAQETEKQGIGQLREDFPGIPLEIK